MQQFVDLKREVIIQRYNRLIAQLQEAGTRFHLDYGCGRGGFAKSVKGDIPEAYVAGYDPDESVIALATKPYGPQAHPKVRFTSDLRAALPEGGNLFTSVSVAFVLHDTERPEAELAKIRNIMQPGGLLWVMEHNLPGIDLDEFQRRFSRPEETAELRRYGNDWEALHRAHTRYGAADIERLVAGAGFHTTNKWRDSNYCTIIGHKW
jgi:ubiquinone/menaquinone biosynthesis C-methylase UbiE